MHPTGPIAQRFPLVARIRPACLPLEARLAKLSELAGAGTRQDDPGLASTVFNQAALLASDLALPGLARELCHRHADLYLRLGPLPAMSAIRALEPIVNLARLHIRAGRGSEGHQLLLSLYDAIATGTSTVLDGVTVPARLTETDAQRAEVRAWLWRVVLADGTRALTCSGRWEEALRHLNNHRGVGNRILDGRQVAVLARATTGDLDGALALLADTEPGDPWENAVTAVLTALCTPGGQQEAAAALDHCQRLETGPGLAVFTTRLILTAIDAAGWTTNETARNLAQSLIIRSSESDDGYAARDLLARAAYTDLLTRAQVSSLRAVVRACALGDGHLPAVGRAQLEEALTEAARVLEKAPFDRSAPGPDPLERIIRRPIEVTGPSGTPG